MFSISFHLHHYSKKSKQKSFYSSNSSIPSKNWKSLVLRARRTLPTHDILKNQLAHLDKCSTVVQTSDIHSTISRIVNLTKNWDSISKYNLVSDESFEKLVEINHELILTNSPRKLVSVLSAMANLRIRNPEILRRISELLIRLAPEFNSLDCVEIIKSLAILEVKSNQSIEAIQAQLLKRKTSNVLSPEALYNFLFYLVELQMNNVINKFSLCILIKLMIPYLSNQVIVRIIPCLVILDAYSYSNMDKIFYIYTNSNQYEPVKNMKSCKTMVWAICYSGHFDTEIFDAEINKSRDELNWREIYHTYSFLKTTNYKYFGINNINFVNSTTIKRIQILLCLKVITFNEKISKILEQKSNISILKKGSKMSLKQTSFKQIQSLVLYIQVLAEQDSCHIFIEDNIQTTCREQSMKNLYIHKKKTMTVSKFFKHFLVRNKIKKFSYDGPITADIYIEFCLPIETNFESTTYSSLNGYILQNKSTRWIECNNPLILVGMLFINMYAYFRNYNRVIKVGVQIKTQLLKTRDLEILPVPEEEIISLKPSNVLGQYLSKLSYVIGSKNNSNQIL